MSNEMSAVWINLSANQSFDWAGLIYFSLTFVLGIATLIVLWRNLVEMRRTRHQSFFPQIEITGADILVRFSDDEGRQRFSLELGKKNSDTLGKMPRVVNLGGGSASQVRIKGIFPSSVTELVDEINARCENLSFECTSEKNIRYLSFGEMHEKEHLSYRYLSFSKKTVMFNYILPEDKSISDAVLESYKYYEYVALQALLLKLKSSPNTIGMFTLQSKTLIEIDYITTDGTKCTVKFRPVLTTVTEIIYSHPPYSLKKTFDYYCSLSFKKV